MRREALTRNSKTLFWRCSKRGRNKETERNQGAERTVAWIPPEQRFRIAKQNLLICVSRRRDASRRVASSGDRCSSRAAESHNLREELEGWPKAKPKPRARKMVPQPSLSWGGRAANRNTLPQPSLSWGGRTSKTKTSKTKTKTKTSKTKTSKTKTTKTKTSKTKTKS